MRTVWCHLKTTTSLNRRLAVAPPVWRGGPHREEGLQLDVELDLGRYAPAFETFLGEEAIIGKQSPALKRATQPVYDAVLKPLAHIYLRAKLSLESHPEILSAERKYLLQHTRAPGGLAGRAWHPRRARWHAAGGHAVCLRWPFPSRNRPRQAIVARPIRGAALSRNLSL